MGCYTVLGDLGSPHFGWGAADLGSEMSLGSLPLASAHRIGLTLMQSFRTPSCALENTPEAYDNRTWVQPASAFPACVLGASPCTFGPHIPPL